MIKNENFWTRITRNTYGIFDNLDEYKKNRVNEIGNKIFMMASRISILIFFISTIIYIAYGAEYGFLTYFILFLIQFFIFSIIISSKIKANNLDIIDISRSEKNKAQKVVRALTFRDTILSIVVFVIVYSLLNFAIYGKDFIKSIFMNHDYLTLLAYLIVFIPLRYKHNKSRVNFYDEES